MTKILLYKMLVRPIALHGVQCWRNEKMEDVFKKENSAKNIWPY
jgi:hypothetical protein